MKHLWFGLLFASLAGCTTLAATPATPASSARQAAADTTAESMPDPAAAPASATASALTSATAELMPEGANLPCPASADTVPVVLIHGTFANARRAFRQLAPTLRNEGRCVYAINYGKRSKLPRVFATGDMEESARELQAFIDTVRQTTGAAQVDLIGHSQGGTLALFLGKVNAGKGIFRRIVAISPSTRGTQTAKSMTSESACPACAQQAPDSAFIRRLHEGSVNPARIPTLILSTDNDLVVTPLASQFVLEPAVTNLRLQQLFPGKFATHSGILQDADAVRYITDWVNRRDP